MGEIIDTEYKEIDVKAEELMRLGAEIRSITKNMQITVIVNVIEIGKRFEEAKNKLGHGNWGQWCKECTGYSQSMAENYIKIYKEYGNEQLSIFGDLTESQSIKNLSMTKLLELTAVPADERERFVEDNNITDDTTVKELQTLIRQKEAENSNNSEALKKAREEIESLKKKNVDEAQKKQARIDSLTEKLSKMEEKTAEADNTYRNSDPGESILSQYIKEAEERAKEKIKKEIENITKDKDKAEKKAKDLDNKLSKMKEAEENTKKKLDVLTNSLETEKNRSEELESTIEKLKKESQLGSNQNIIKLNFLFEKVQDDISDLNKTLELITDTEKHDKLHNAITATLSEAVSNI